MGFKQYFLLLFSIHQGIDVASISLNNGIYVPSPPEREAAQVRRALPQYKARSLCTLSSSTNTSYTCSNWAGTNVWTPASVFMPQDEQELASFLHQASTKSHPVKVVGHGHSWAGLYLPAKASDGKQGSSIVLHHLSGITKLMPLFEDQSSLLTTSDNMVEASSTIISQGVGHVEVMAGTSFADLHEELNQLGLNLAWQSGGIQGLTVGGAVSVGFHGSQMSLGSISSVVSRMHVMDTNGGMHILDQHNPSDRSALAATSLGVGVCGIITRVTLPVVPTFHLKRRRWRVDDIPQFLTEQLSGLKKQYDRFHYYIHPHSATAWPMYWEDTTVEASLEENRPCRTALEQVEDAQENAYGIDGLPLIMRWDECSDVSYRAYTHAVDMEAQPLWNGEWFLSLSDEDEGKTVLGIMERFQEVAAAHEKDGLPDLDLWLHVRYMHGDDETYLNPCHGWGVCAGFELALVAKTMDSPLPPKEDWYRYFDPFEAYLKSLGARPHWAKDHAKDADYMASSGLPIADFLQECRAFDPQGLLGKHPELSSVVVA